MYPQPILCTCTKFFYVFSTRVVQIHSTFYTPYLILLKLAYNPQYGLGFGVECQNTHSTHSTPIANKQVYTTTYSNSAYNSQAIIKKVVI